jgi:hypothetical protein
MLGVAVLGCVALWLALLVVTGFHAVVVGAGLLLAFKIIDPSPRHRNSSVPRPQASQAEQEPAENWEQAA